MLKSLKDRIDQPERQFENWFLAEGECYNSTYKLIKLPIGENRRWHYHKLQHAKV